MDPVSAELLTTLAVGAGGAAGRQLWTGLSALVRRPFRQCYGGSSEVAMTCSGEAELTALEQSPDNGGYAEVLAAVLAERAATDLDFSNKLDEWHEQARSIGHDNHTVSNMITGGTFQGTVVQGRDFSDLSINTPGTLPAYTDGETQTQQG